MRLEIDLPSPGERDDLLDALAQLVAAGGSARFLVEPLLPTPHWFPDPWDGKERGLELLIRRVLAYAGLGRLGVELDVAATPRDECDLTAAWFAGFREGRVRFGIRTSLLGEPMAVGAAVAHEVAHAWRAERGVPGGDDQEQEELLTDLTTVYLGFGVLTTNAASLHRSSGSFEGVSVSYAASHTRLGYLPMSSLAFLLAAQLVAQGAGRRERDRVGSSLEANQRQAFERALKVLRPDPVALRRRLGIAGEQRPRARPAPRALAEVDSLVTGDEVVSADQESAGWAAAAPRAPSPRNEGRNVFRVRRRWLGRASVVFVGSGALLSLVAVVLADTLASSDPFATWAFLVLAWVAAGLAARPWARFHEWCSDPDCAAPLLGVEDRCPGCDGRIRGVIRSANERLAAEEALGEDENDLGYECER